jgi:hypothetical protein
MAVIILVRRVARADKLDALTRATVPSVPPMKALSLNS